MIISELEIKNYKNLKNIKLSNLEKLVILTGKNSSGKSNILEALWLFSKDFSLIPLTNAINAPIEANSNLWTNADTRYPISFKAKFILDVTESNKIVSSNILAPLKLQNKNLEFTIEREIIPSPPNMSWTTKSIQLYDLDLVKEANIITKLSSLKTKDNIRENLNETKFETAERPIKLSGEELDDTKLKEILEKITADDISLILNNLSKLIQNEFKLILAFRNSLSALPNYSSRSLSIEQSIYNEMLMEGQNLSYSTRSKWRRLMGDFEKIIPYQHRINIISSQIFIDEPNITIPIQSIGGGSQNILDLMHELNFKMKPITMIEEPENHMHPELQKKFYNYLLTFIKSKSYDKQLWLSTHSPFFLNKIDLKNIWFVKKNEDNEAEITNLIEKRDLKETILALGVKPSDLLFSDAILLVDGTTEEFVLPIWAKKFGINLIDLGCDIIPISDENKAKYHLGMWRDITKDTEIPIFIMLDKHAEKEAKKLIDDKKIDEDCCLISNKFSIEEYYPKPYLVDAIKEEFGLDIPLDSIENTKPETISKLLIDKGMEIENNWWKPLIGIRVAEKMKPNEIPIEYRKIFEKIKIKLE